MSVEDPIELSVFSSISVFSHAWYGGPVLVNSFDDNSVTTTVPGSSTPVVTPVPVGLNRPNSAGLGQGHATLPFPPSIRRVIYTTNAIESINAQLRKIIKTRGHFPSDNAATKLIWLALRNITADWGVQRKTGRRR